MSAEAETVEEPRASEATVEPPASPEPATRSDHPQLEDITCRLGFWWTPTWCLVSLLSDEISDDLQSGLARRILAAVEDDAPEERLLSWPPFSKRSVVRSEGAEFRALLVSLSDAACQGRRLLVLGLEEEQTAHANAIREVLVPEEAVSVSGPALSEMAANPEGKRALWRRLREVCRVSA
ncbi:hypothetical protein C8D92_1013 [Tamilnaduibacter salinus]|uniref:Uncharacterized protein n=1 Tax=Tamilnaduibacter salinus TaxID=1484056 RepID=A0A2U1D0K3_9GAMM|nr:hypothetical protein [Tamilnaduibacter salinus]PVY78801.1 hypothetical protein C8D92_1013 [Tamilnaduibacter salinus]